MKQVGQLQVGLRSPASLSFQLMDSPCVNPFASDDPRSLSYPPTGISTTLACPRAPRWLSRSLAGPLACSFATPPQHMLASQVARLLALSDRAQREHSDHPYAPNRGAAKKLQKTVRTSEYRHFFFTNSAYCTFLNRRSFLRARGKERKDGGGTRLAAQIDFFTVRIIP